MTLLVSEPFPKGVDWLAPRIVGPKNNMRIHKNRQQDEGTAMSSLGREVHTEEVLTRPGSGRCLSFLVRGVGRGWLVLDLRSLIVSFLGALVSRSLSLSMIQTGQLP